MTLRTAKERRVFEIMLIVVTLGMTCLLYRMGAHKLVALNLFFLPVVLAGYYLGRTMAGILALLAALAVAIVTTVDATGFASYTTPVMMGLVLTLWAAVLGMTAILVGTLCDEQTRTVDELQEAYVGVVEVLSKYLQSANPNYTARSIRIAKLSQEVAEVMKLSRKQIDDIRVGALLHDLGNVEITTQVLTRAVDTLETTPQRMRKHTFLGQDLVHSLGSVLSGAFPLLVDQDDPAEELLASEYGAGLTDIPIGAKIIRAVRAYDALTTGDSGESKATRDEALSELHRDAAAGYDHEVLAAIERVFGRHAHTHTPEPVALV